MFPLILLQVDVLDLWKLIVITLFILSMINERITNFVKLNIESILTRLLGLERYERLFNQRTNFKLVEPDPTDEKLRERGILNWAVVCGFFVAVACGADLFFLIPTGQLLQPASYDKFWDIRKALGALWRHGIGFLLTGFFISLGSKFWHDLLDLILYTSNLKRKLVNEPELFRSGSADEVAELAELTTPQLAQLALRQYEDRLRQHPDVVDLAVGVRLIDGLVRDALTVFLKGEKPAGLPASISVRLASGRQLAVPVLFMPNYGQSPMAQFGVGSAIRPANSPLQGTLCCLLNGTDPDSNLPATYALTCSHVVTQQVALNRGGFFQDASPTTVEVGSGLTGTWRYGLLNRAYDIALVQLAVGTMAQFVPTLNRNAVQRSLTKTDVEQRTELLVLTQSGLHKTRLNAIYRGELRVRYANNEQKELVGLIELSGKNGQSGAPTLPGDSGALVYDDQKKLVGMIVAGNTGYSYMLSMADILQTLSDEIPNLSVKI